MATTFKINPYFGDAYAGESDLIVVQPLALVSSVPADAASGVAVGSGITLEFNEEPAAVGTVTLQVSGGATVETFDLSTPGLIDGSTVTLDPSADLSDSASYDVVIGSDLANLAGTAFAGDTISFSTATPDATAPVLSAASATADGETAVSWSVTTDEGSGTIYRGLWPDGAAPSDADVKAGTGAVQFGSLAVATTGAKSGSFSGLSVGTAYEFFAVQEDAAGNLSAAVSAGVTTDAPAPIEPAVLATGMSSFTSDSFTSPGSNGLLAIVATCSSSTTGDTFSMDVVESGGARTPMVSHGSRADRGRINIQMFHLASPPTGTIQIEATSNNGVRDHLVMAIDLAGFSATGNATGGAGDSATSSAYSTLVQSIPGSIVINALARAATGGAVTWTGATSLVGGSVETSGGSEFQDVSLDVAYRIMDGTAADTLEPSWVEIRDYAMRLGEFG